VTKKSTDDLDPALLKFFEPLAEKVVALEKRLAYCEKRLGVNIHQRNCPKCGKLEHRADGTICGVCGAKLKGSRDV
jgi:ribosomal protein S27AE